MRSSCGRYWRRAGDPREPIRLPPGSCQAPSSHKWAVLMEANLPTGLTFRLRGVIVGAGCQAEGAAGICLNSGASWLRRALLRNYRLSTLKMADVCATEIPGRAGAGQLCSFASRHHRARFFAQLHALSGPRSCADASTVHTGKRRPRTCGADRGIATPTAPSIIGRWKCR